MVSEVKSISSRLITQWVQRGKRTASGKVRHTLLDPWTLSCVTTCALWLGLDSDHYSCRSVFTAHMCCTQATNHKPAYKKGRLLSLSISLLPSTESRMSRWRSWSWSGLLAASSVWWLLGNQVGHFGVRLSAHLVLTARLWLLSVFICCNSIRLQSKLVTIRVTRIKV